MERPLPDQFPFSKPRRSFDDFEALLGLPGLPAPVLPEAAVVVPAVAMAAPTAAAEPQTQDEPWQMNGVLEFPGAERASELARAAAMTRADAAGDVATARGVRDPERRRTSRQALRARATFRSDADRTVYGAVQIVDLSLLGVRILSPRAMKSGERGLLRLEAGPIKWSSRVRVIACEAQQDEEGGGYAVGCEFAGKELIRRSLEAA